LFLAHSEQTVDKMNVNWVSPCNIYAATAQSIKRANAQDAPKKAEMLKLKGKCSVTSTSAPRRRTMSCALIASATHAKDTIKQSLQRVSLNG